MNILKPKSLLSPALISLASINPISAQEGTYFGYFTKNEPHGVISQLGERCLISTAHSYASNSPPKRVGNEHSSVKVRRKDLTEVAREDAFNHDYVIYRDNSGNLTHPNFTTQVSFTPLKNGERVFLDTYGYKPIPLFITKQPNFSLGYLSRNQGIPNCSKRDDKNMCLENICEDNNLGICAFNQRDNENVIPINSSGTRIVNQNNEIVGIQSGRKLLPNELSYAVLIGTLNPKDKITIEENCF